MTASASIYAAAEVKTRARQHLRQPLPGEEPSSDSATVRGDFDLNPGVTLKPGASLTPAAVLIPVIETGTEGAIVFTQRTDELPSHAGQISFPGGKIDKTDRNAIDTALREAEEEIGLARALVDIVGVLDAYQTGTGYRIQPVVGVLRPGYKLVPEPGEVAEIFDVPVRFLMSPENHKFHSQSFGGKERHFHAMQYRDRYIWGATAAILKNLYDRLYKG